MTYQSIILTNIDDVSVITLNRPEALNAISDEMRIELIDALHLLESDSATRVLVVTGRGKAFSAGADLRHVKFLYEEFSRSGLRTPYGGPELAQAFFRFSKPIIAAVNGVAVGWGMTMPLACDIRIASNNAKFSAPFIRAGLTPEFGSTFILPRLVGYGKAAELLLTGRMIQAEEAKDIGLVHSVFPHEELLNETMSLAQHLAVQPPRALIQAKALLRHGMDAPLERCIEHEASVFQERMACEEHYEAVAKLLSQMEKRK